MTAIDPLHPLQSSILETLAVKRDLTIVELRTYLQNQHDQSVSMPNLYRIVSQMVEKQVLVKEKGKLSLNLIWIPHMLGFAENAKKTYLAAGDDVLELPKKDGEHREYAADSLIGLDPIWSHILIAFTKLPQPLPWYAYNSHPWYSLGMRDTEQRVYESIVAQGMECHMLYGNDSFLDRYGDKLIRVPRFHTHLATDTPFPKEGYALWVCNDYMLECVFPEAIARHFAFFFQTVRTIKQFDPELFSDIFAMKARCKIRVRRDKKEANRLRGIVGKYFK